MGDVLMMSGWGVGNKTNDGEGECDDWGEEQQRRKKSSCYFYAPASSPDEREQAARC